MPQEFAISPDIVAHRLPEPAYEANFADLHPPLDHHGAHVAADRCLFCWEAPCVAACPTGIDIPLFIRQISTGNPLAAQGEPRIGMTTKEVKAIWGEPTEVTQEEVVQGRVQTWSYGPSRSVEFDPSGRLSVMQP